jgi:glycopeptide antibiotics resistance protein
MIKTHEQGPDTDSQTWPPPGTGFWTAVAVTVAAATLAAMLYPFDFGTVGGGWMAIRTTNWIAVLANVGLFVPLGLAEGRLVDHVFERRAWTLLLVAVDVALLSFIGETVQLWLPARSSSVVDLVANTLGGALGAWLVPYRRRGRP